MFYLLDILFYIYIFILCLIFIGLLIIYFYPILKKGNHYHYENKNSGDYRVLVVCPLKGEDLTLKENLESLKNQTYKDYKLVAVLDDLKDAALKLVNDEGIDYILTDGSIGKGSGKVKAMATALKRFTDYDIFVTADSDVTFPNDWIEKMVGPFSDPDVGGTTAYPYFEPVGGIWSKVKMVWSLVGNGMMESDSTIFGWGGSLAYRYSLFEDSDIKKFANSLSDDIYITKLIKMRKKRLAYIKDVDIMVKSDDNFGKFFEWSNRQTALTLLGYKSNFKYGMVFYTSQEILFFSAIILSFYYWEFLIFLIPFILSEAKVYKRLRSHKLSGMGIFVIINILYIINLIKAHNLKTIEWRSNKYKLVQEY